MRTSWRISRPTSGAGPVVIVMGIVFVSRIIQELGLSRGVAIALTVVVVGVMGIVFAVRIGWSWIGHIIRRGLCAALRTAVRLRHVRSRPVCFVLFLNLLVYLFSV